MSARATDDARVLEIWTQAQAALRRFEHTGLTLDDLVVDHEPEDETGMFVDAIFKNVYQVAEEATNLDIDTMLEFPSYPWGQIRGMRNRVAHEYFSFDGRYLYDALTCGLPELLGFCEEYARRRGFELPDDRRLDALSASIAASALNGGSRNCHGHTSGREESR